MIIKTIKVNHHLLEQNQRLLQHLNTSCLNKRQISQLLTEIFGYQVDESDKILLPFYSDYGRNIRLGKNVFISCNVTMADQGGIKIDDNVSIGPGMTFLTGDGNQVGPIKVDSDVKMGGNVTILPDVHIGSNVVIGVGLIITHDIPEGRMVLRSKEGGII